MTTEKFLQGIFGIDAKVNFRAIKGSDSKKFGGKYCDLKDKLSELNDEGYNIYYVVNSGGDSDLSINKVNSVFIDFDCGRDKNNEYYDLETVSEYKKQKIDLVLSDPFKPSYIVETRNGIHVYWLVDGVEVDYFHSIQEFLIDKYDSDKTIKNLSRVMRLPNYYWTKDIDNMFMCEVIYSNDIRYPFDELSLGVGYSKDIESITPILFSTPKEKEISQYDLIGKIINRDTEFLKRYYNMPSVIVENNYDLMNYIKSIDMRFILGIKTTKSFKCLFHKDNNPSAMIFKNEDGHYFYKCHSESCGVGYNILNIIESLGCFKSRPKAFKFIKEIFNIKMELTEFQKEQIDILECNINFLMFDLKEQYPVLYKNVRHNIDFLIKLNQYAKTKVFTESYTTEEGSAIFHASNKELLEIAGLSKNSDSKISKKITLLQYHDLIDKLSDEEIPDNMLTKAQAISSKYGLIKRKNFYSFPSYNTLSIAKSNDKAIRWINFSYSAKGISREMFFRKEGSEVADKLYPQHTHITENGVKKSRATNKSQDDIQMIFAKIIKECIDSKGYFREIDLVNYEIFLRDNKISKTATEKFFKRNLPELLDSYGLVRIRATKEIKQKYNIDSKVSPIIITELN